MISNRTSPEFKALHHAFAARCGASKQLGKEFVTVERLQKSRQPGSPPIPAITYVLRKRGEATFWIDRTSFAIQKEAVVEPISEVKEELQGRIAEALAAINTHPTLGGGSAW